MEKIKEEKMSIFFVKKFKQWRKKQGKTSKQEISVLLDRDSLERLERLRLKIKTLDNDELIASALKCLEDKADRIIKKQVKRRIWTLSKEGFNPEQIADLLNIKNIPALGETNSWNNHSVSLLLKQEGDESVKKIWNH
jgi:hypothetical protein